MPGRPVSTNRSFEADRYDAIHRALRAGLLGNIGVRTAPHEYTGARGTKFAIFPGSALFKTEPRWVVAAELLETTRLYARTVGAVQPEWIEHIGEHLVKRTHFDPHWNEATAHVVAYEKVTLYGVAIIPQRTVHYGPIDPKAAREIFIRKALVEGQYRTDAPFFRHNQRLVEEIQRLEAKARSRDVLVADQARYDFYDARIPAGIHNGPAFEKWRRETEKRNPRLLHMSRRDLMMHAASGVTQEMFPDAMIVNGLRVLLEYHLEPGHPADGVTATLPIAALNQVPAERFEWLVPGLLREKLTALIKSLPKALRVRFVPAPDFAEQALATLRPGDGSLCEALAMFLGKAAGVPVSPGDFDAGSLLDHLHMNFKIVDDAGRQLAMGRDLDELRRKLGVQVRKSFEQMPQSQWSRTGITRWDFGDLPRSVQVQRHGMTLQGFPALEDRGDSLALRLFDSPAAADASHRAGLRRLFMLELRDELKYLVDNLPGISQMCLQYAPLGRAEDLKADLVAAAVDQVFAADANVRTAMEYELRKEGGRRHKLLEAGRQIAELAGGILSAYHEAELEMPQRVPELWQRSIADVRQQLAGLMGRGFMLTPQRWLAQLPRFLSAVRIRLKKLKNAGLLRDQQNMQLVRPHVERHAQAVAKLGRGSAVDADLVLYRWMIEEYRVSLWAQEMRTSIPVSAKRLDLQWQRLGAISVRGQMQTR